MIFTKDFVFFTIQGEGRFVGQPSVFVRLSTCNLRCEWQNPDSSTSLCDTAYSSHYPELEEHEIKECIDRVLSFDCPQVVITGGEPFLQEGLADLVEPLVEKGCFVSIETNGSIYQKTKAQFLSISPKLKSSCVSTSEHYDEHQSLRYNSEVLQQMCTEYDFQLKYVINTKDDLHEVASQVVDFKKWTDKDVDSRVYLMPQALTKAQLEERSEWLIEECKKTNWNFCDRLHIRIWGPKRGK